MVSENSPRQKISTVLSGPPISMAGLQEHIRGADLSGLDVVKIIQYACNNLVEPVGGIDFVYQGHSVDVWSLGAIWLAALSSGNPFRLAAGASARVDLLSLAKVAGGLTTEARLAADADEVVKVEARKTLLRLVCMQSALQTDPRSDLLRTGVLLGIIDQDGVEQAASFLDPLFNAAFGCSTKQYWSIMYGIWVTSTPTEQNGSPSTGFAIDNFIPRASAEMQTALGTIAAGMSVEPSEVQVSIAQKQSVGIDGSGLVHAIFADTPLLRADERSFIFPPHPFTRMHATIMPIFAAIALAHADAVRRGSSKPHTNTYTTQMGEIFEEFLNKEVSRSFASEDIHFEYVYELDGSGRNGKRSPDIIVFRGDTCLLIQAKLKRWSPGTFYGSSMSAFEEDARGALAEMVWKSLRYLSNLAEGMARGSVPETYRDLSTKVLAARRYVLLGCSPALPPVLKFEPYREVVSTRVNEEISSARGKAAELDLWKTKTAAWHIMDWSEVAVSEQVRPRGVSLVDDLISYVEYIGSSPPVDHTSTVPSFRDWSIQRYRATDLLPPATHQRGFATMAGIAQRLMLGE